MSMDSRAQVERTIQHAKSVVTGFLVSQGFEQDKAEFAANDQVSRTPYALLKRVLAGDAKAIERMKL